MVYNAALHIDESDLFSGHCGLWYTAGNHWSVTQKSVYKKKENKKNMFKTCKISEVWLLLVSYDFGNLLNYTQTYIYIYIYIYICIYGNITKYFLKNP